MSNSNEATTEGGPTYKVTISGDGVTVDKEVDAEVATSLLALVMGGTAPAVAAGTGRRSRTGAPRRRAKNAGGASGGSTSKTAKKKPGSVSIVRNLVLRPTGTQSWAEFAAEKKPRSNPQKCVVAVDWLAKVGGMSSGITVDHVNTCFVDANWKRPSDLYNALQVVASTKGWLDTSDMGNIKITARGEDEVRHNLPPASKSK